MAGFEAEPDGARDGKGARKREGVMGALVMGAVVSLILVALVSPMYADYTGRTRVAEGLVLASAFKNLLLDYHEEHGRWPEGTAEEIARELGKGTFVATQNTKQIQILADGVIEIEPAKRVEGGGRKVFLIPDVDANGRMFWRCENGTGAQALKRHNLPTECRGSE